MNDINIIYSRDQENMITDEMTDAIYLDNYEILDTLSQTDIDECNNDTLEEEFLYELDKTWDTGDIIFAQNAIKKYKDLISPCYIEKAFNAINELVIEKFENSNMNDDDMELN